MNGMEPIGELLPDKGTPGRRRQTPPDEVPLSEQEELTLELVQLGIALRKAEHLVKTYPRARILQQIAWLPARSPKHKASLLITAIENNYGKPAYANEG